MSAIVGTDSTTAYIECRVAACSVDELRCIAA